MWEKSLLLVEEIKRKLEHYCVYQDRCHKEVESKLREYKVIPEARELILLSLMKDNFLNEERFAKSFARGKFRIKKWGKQRIVRELKFKDISAYNIKTALKEIDEQDYLATFDDLAEKRLKQITETDIYKKRKKLADYLLYRGWESNLVYTKINELIAKK
ncbi:regulatory protein RecX [Tenacibaculum aquimarinum]|uniref:regulatory protein RecX n=1 Tax=Tenacibaculum aquimarinum TaxID=2910675 RepID=UPI001F0B5A85|nr:regulatory protein RecX [Tenacibaculum aquimarinum]MCH3883464.1 RecX family transcriptional regulator [Tenacibaculum aquimarinum]